MTLRTALTIQGNYPDNILVCSSGDIEGNYSALGYLLKGGQAHTLLVSTEPMFNTPKEAIEAMHVLLKDICDTNYLD